MEENRENVNYEDELSIKELIQVVFNGKKTILLVTIITILISGIFSFFILSEKFESSVMLLTSPINSNFEEANNLSDISGLVTQYPNISIETYMEQIKSNQLLKDTIVELNLTNSGGQLISSEALLSMIRISNIKSTNLLIITVTDTDPEKAQLIANTLGENFIDFISENNRKISFEAARIIEEKLNIEEANLEEKSKKFVEYINENGDINALQSEVSTLLGSINSDQASLIQLEREIERGKLVLNTLLDTYDFDIDTDLIQMDYTIDENYEVIEAIKLDLSNSKSIQDALIQIEITKSETELINNISDYIATSNHLEELKTKYTEKKSLLSENTIEYDKITREVSLSSQAYNTYQEMHKVAIEASTSEIGRSSVIISSTAEISEYPVSPNKKLNVIIGAIFGLILGTFIVFVKYMWYTDKSKFSTNEKV